MREINWRRLIKYLRPYRGRIVGIFFLMIVSTLLSLPGPLIIKILIDNAIMKGNIRLIGIIGIAFIGLSLMQFLFSILQAHLFSSTSQGILYTQILHEVALR